MMPLNFSPQGVALLLADDDQDIRDALGDWLRYCGYSVTCVGTGAEALREFTISDFGAVILDLGLPDIDGLTLLKGLKKIRTGVPVIVLTALNNDTYKLRALTLGAYSYLVKPYNKQVLQSVLAEALRTCALPSSRPHLSVSLSSIVDGIIHQGPSVIQVKDLQGRYLFVNRQWEQVFRRTATGTIGKSVLDVFPHDIADALRANDLRVQQTHQSVELKEHVIHDSVVHIYRSLKFPLFDESGTPYGVCGIATDISEEIETGMSACVE